MRTRLPLLLACLSVGAAFAGPADKAEPVAAGYPQWTGVTARNYIAGRRLTPSDLRHKVTVVVEIEPGAKLVEQMSDAASLAPRLAYDPTAGADFPRDRAFVLSVCGGKGRGKVLAVLDEQTTLKDADARQNLAALRQQGASVYEDVSYTGATNSVGLRPCVYVMGPSGSEPLYWGKLDAAARTTVRNAIAKGQKEIDGWGAKWRPFYGTVEEPKFHPQLAKALAKGKPLGPVTKEILKNVTASDPEKAKEAQILYDALNQTCGDLIAKVEVEWAQSPHLAYADALTVMKYWPSEKQKLDAFLKKAMSDPDLAIVLKAFARMADWKNPDFTPKNAGETKKIVADLNKMKKALGKLKESKNFRVQNAASLVDMSVDDLLGKFKK